jgi:hypothetical protein
MNDEPESRDPGLDPQGSPRPGGAAVLHRALVERALDEGDAAHALRWIDELPAAEQPDWLVDVWILAGSPRAVRQVLPAVRDSARRARAERFLADPPPIAPLHAASYEVLTELAARHAANGLASALACAHLGLAELAPRSDWRALHVEHASSLASGLDDPRLSALVAAFEARLDADFGDAEEAFIAANHAVAEGEAHLPLAALWGHLVLDRLGEAGALERARVVAHALGVPLPVDVWGLGAPLERPTLAPPPSDDVDSSTSGDPS